MKKGIFRIVAGSIMILLQLIAMIGSRRIFLPVYSLYAIGYYIGFYSIGITGIILLSFGVSAYKKDLRSQLILHTNNKKLHTVVRWVLLAIIVIKFISNLYVHILYRISVLEIYTIMIMLSNLLLAVYLLFYIYRKPCCLFSAFLVFRGIAYLYSTYDNDLLSHITGNASLINCFRFIPMLVNGTLFIIVACMLYKENFSVKVVKTLGWIIFAMEISISFIYPILFDIYWRNSIVSILLSNCISAAFSLPFTVGVLLYTSVFELNTLNKQLLCGNCENTLSDSSSVCDYSEAEIPTAPEENIE